MYASLSPSLNSAYDGDNETSPARDATSPSPSFSSAFDGTTELAYETDNTAVDFLADVVEKDEDIESGNDNFEEVLRT